ncbi:kinase-like domain-containing protein [Coniella lustricola]|uniref:Kinase-like domain-containing protein n=1 Tax=Coniella lustricola TaxID=2025994 RepID=A0A2T3A7V3_9PEZI|nr:kinase-like domain-containing protein [Coniella lustricola]
MAEYDERQLALLGPALDQSEESTKLQTSDSEQQEFFTALQSLPPSALPLDCDLSETPNPSDQLADVSMDQLAVRWDPRIRVVFKCPRGLTIQIDQAEQQALTISSRPQGSSEHTPFVDLIGCIQGRSDAMFSLKAGIIHCNFFYMPNCDNVIMYNWGDLLEVQCGSESEFSAKLPSTECCTLTLGTWKVGTPKQALEFQLWPRQYSITIEEERLLRKRKPNTRVLPAAKRSHMPGPDRLPLMHLETPLSLSLEGEIARIAYTLADDEDWLAYRPSEGQTLSMRHQDADDPGYCLAYEHTRWERQSRISHTFKAIMIDDRTSAKPVVVKSFKQPHKMYAQEEGKRRLAITSAARMWYTEFKQHRQLDHPQIARLLGYDARIHTLFIEFHSFPDLSSLHWRSNAGLFKGSHTDAHRILTDISSALIYLEDKGILHNDIKPGNILYGENFAGTRSGAILIDFGMAQEETGSLVMGGTPWYVPREFAEARRGYPADIWSLGISMLYLRKHIQLPEKLPQYQGWNLAECRGGHIPEQMLRWLKAIGNLQSNLQASCWNSKREGYELDLIICKMLKENAGDRITRSELVQQTREWRDRGSR